MQHLTIVTTGGTIDKIYFDDKSDYKIGAPQIGEILGQLGVAFQFDVIPILRKDSLRALAGDSLGALRTACAGWLDDNDDMHAASAIRQTLDAAARWLDQHAAARDTLEAGARGLAFTLARCAAAALLARQATWSDRHGDRRPAAARRRFVALGLDRLVAPDADNTALLLG